MSPSQNSHLTFKANIGVGRHGWLRLTPAYSVTLVRERVAHLPPKSVVTDPFSGTGTTPLAAAEHGHLGQALDVNPFLVWLGTAKTTQYDEDSLGKTLAGVADLTALARSVIHKRDLWQPNLYQIERWWSPSALNALKALRHAIDVLAPAGEPNSLYSIALCRTLISASNAAFNHQSMSFKANSNQPSLFDEDQAEVVIATFARELETLVASARINLAGTARII